MNAGTARVFFALWPDTVLRAALYRAARRLHPLHGGRLTQPETLHLTLLFIGALARERLPELRLRARAIRAPGFQLIFDQADCWRHNRVAFLAASRIPIALSDLVLALERVAEAEAIDFDRRPYKAHVTVARKADCAKQNPALGRATEEGREPPRVEPVIWNARDFVLVESRPRPEGPGYTILERFSLS